MKLNCLSLVLVSYCSTNFCFDPAEHFFEKMKTIEQKYRELSEPEKENVQKAVIELADYFDDVDDLVITVNELAQIKSATQQMQYALRSVPVVDYLRNRIDDTLEQNKVRELMCNFGKSVNVHNKVNPISDRCEQIYTFMNILRDMKEQLIKK